MSFRNDVHAVRKGDGGREGGEGGCGGQQWEERGLLIAMQHTLPDGLCELEPAFHSTSLKPLFAFQLPKLLLGSALGVATLPLVIVVAFLLKAFLVCFFQSQNPSELPNPGRQASRFHRSNIQTPLGLLVPKPTLMNFPILKHKHVLWKNC